MKVCEIAKKLGAETLSLPEPEREFSSVYAGDLLSWVMSHAEKGSAWITVMTNPTVIALALMCEFACVIITDGADVDDDFTALAKEKNVDLLRSHLSSYEVCARIAEMM